MNGFINVDKPRGMTSSDVVLSVRKRLPRGTKIGHAGTLDPEASGVLPLMIGKATRLFDLLTEKEKEYVAEWIPGSETDTQDAFGRVILQTGKRASREALEAVLPAFTGTIAQTPPMYSAIKRNGKRLYELAHAGESVQLEPRPVRIDAIQVMEAREDGSFLLRVRCGRGTYIRTLCHDLGRAVGCGAHMGTLTRTMSGVFTLDDAQPLETLLSAEDLTPFLMPMDAPLGEMPAASIRQEAARFVRNGNPLTAAEVTPFPAQGQRVRLYLDGVFCGLGKRGGDAVRFEMMLL